MKKVLFTLSLLITLSNIVVGQVWNWPENRAMAEEKNVLYTDAIKMGDFKSAVSPLQWLINEAPDLNSSLYKNGAKIYDNLAKVEKDPSKKGVYIDSLMLMYDMRMKYFKDSINVMNRKATKAYKYYKRDESKAEWLLAMFDVTYKISGNKVMNQNLMAYMDVIRVNKKVKKSLTDEEVMQRYEVITEVIENKISALELEGASTERITKQKNAIDKMLTEIVHIDCSFVEETMGPKFKATPDDIKLVKRMFSFMLTGKCTDSPLFLDVEKQLQKLEPTYGISKDIGKRCFAKGEYSCAAEYFNIALKSTEDGVQKAEIYILKGKMDSKRNNKPSARQNYRKALSEDPANKESWLLIGDLYYHSYEQCKKMEDKVQDRLVFIAAYDMYKKAGNTKKMHSAKMQFPSKEEIFTDNYTSGQTMTVGCWINQKVTLQSRD
jgi:tetratricopeptide (TPR) repeat protein